jgi:hypothetical protein
VGSSLVLRGGVAANEQRMKKGFLMNMRSNKDELFHRFRYVGKGSAFTNDVFLLHQLHVFEMLVSSDLAER